MDHMQRPESGRSALLAALAVAACGGGFGGASPTTAPSAAATDAPDAPGHRAASAERGGGARDARLVRRRQQRDAGEARKGLVDAYTAMHPNVTIEIETPPGRHRGRQPRQDPARHRRHDRHLLVQLRLAPAGAQPGGDAGRPVRRAVHRQHRGVLPADGVARAAASSASRARRRWAAASSTTRRSTRDLGLTVPKTWAEFAANNEKHQGRRHRARRRDLQARTPGPRSCSSSPTTATSRRPSRLRRALHEQQDQVRRHPGGAGRLRSTSRKASRRAGSRRTSAPPRFDDGLRSLADGRSSPSTRC